MIANLSQSKPKIPQMFDNKDQALTKIEQIFKKYGPIRLSNAQQHSRMVLLSVILTHR
jgi:hypothetical protein